MTSAASTVEDCTSEFVLRHKEGAALPDLASLQQRDIPTVHWREAWDEEQKASRLKVWELKTSLDNIDTGTYRRARDRVFPLSVGGAQVSRIFFNRAGYKLLESMEATGVWLHLQKMARADCHAPRVAFTDLCGGPGAFSQAIFAKSAQYKLRMKGFGMTLSTAGKALDWYPQLAQNDFTATYGIDGTGDVYQLTNVNALLSITQGSNMLLVVADGGFRVDFAVENYQETICARIVYCQWVGALKLLRVGGCLVLKLFDTFSPLTRCLLYLSTFLFGAVHIVKPKHSRVANSERYLVCCSYTGMPHASWMPYLDHIYVNGFLEEDHVPEILPPAWANTDSAFMAGIREVNERIAKNQCTALQMIIAEATSDNSQVPETLTGGS